MKAELKNKIDFLYELSSEDNDVIDNETFNEWLKRTSPEFYWDFPHLLLIQSKLERIESGDLKKLILSCPPRHGKSEQVTIRFCVYMLKKYVMRKTPKKIIIGAHNQRLASSFSALSRGIARRELKLEEGSQAKDEWNVQGGCGLKAVGVGAGITGNPGSHGGLLIDDPVKGFEEANSEAYRERCWGWYQTDLYTRLAKDGWIIIIMCMTGDTPVLMGDGSEKQLKDIKIGDIVATYDKGKLRTSIVKNHCSNGDDFIYKITMNCGKIVHANERHPFLVEEDGELKWVKLKDLSTENKIVILKDRKENGKERNALLMDAKNQQNAEDIATHIIIKKNGLTDQDRHLLIQNLEEKQDSSIDMESQQKHMTKCLSNRMENVQFVENQQKKLEERTGVENYVSITATKQEKSEDCFAMIAISPQDMQKQKKSQLKLQDISDFTTDNILKIEKAGIKEVFDMQVEDTENFIANGLVSHNTRWHQDDLVGRILASEDAPNWEVVNIPALAEENDILGRKVGEALCPQLYTKEQLEDRKRVLGRHFYALYQGRPSPEEGNVIDITQFKHFETIPDFDFVGQFWDTAFKTKESNDFSVGLTYGVSNHGFYIIDRLKFKKPFNELKFEVRRWAYEHNPDVIVIEDKASGQSIIQELQTDSKLPIVAFRPDRDKGARAASCTSTIAAGNVYINKKTAWANDFLDNLAVFPNGMHDDDVDAFTMGLLYLTKRFANTFPVYRDYNDNLHVFHGDINELSFATSYVGIYLDTVISAVVIGITENNRVVVFREFISSSSLKSFLQDELFIYLKKVFGNIDLKYNLIVDRPDHAWMEDFDKYSLDISNISDKTHIERIECVQAVLTKLIKGDPAFNLIAQKCSDLREGFKGAYNYKARTDLSDMDFMDKPVKNRYSRIHTALQAALADYDSYIYDKYHPEAHFSEDDTGRSKLTGY